ERIVLETDSPYLAPVPHRGKRNEPAYIQLIAQKVADIYEKPLLAIEVITTQNAKKLFNLPVNE
ncbi:MAG: TatD family hydrolase, partial [Bacteroidia bacterium]|nr:TatD family hydrolase [Bacteroidia bacterium]